MYGAHCSDPQAVSGCFGFQTSWWYNSYDWINVVYFRMKWGSPWALLADSDYPKVTWLMYTRHNTFLIQRVPSLADWSFKIWRISLLIIIKEMSRISGLTWWLHGANMHLEVELFLFLLWSRLIQPNFYLHSWTPSFLLMKNFWRPSVSQSTRLSHHHKQELFNVLTKYTVLYVFN